MICICKFSLILLFDIFQGGPCGVLASVQAHIMKCLMFGSYVSPDFSPASPLRPSTKEWNWALISALTEILWRAGSYQRATLALYVK